MLTLALALIYQTLTLAWPQAIQAKRGARDSVCYINLGLGLAFYYIIIVIYEYAHVLCAARTYEKVNSWIAEDPCFIRRVFYPEGVTSPNPAEPPIVLAQSSIRSPSIFSKITGSTLSLGVHH